MNNYMSKDKFFYAIPKLFPDWPYPSRYAIGMNFSDFKAMESSTFRFRIKDKMYEISKEKALELGNKYKLACGVMPNLIPKEEFVETVCNEADPKFSNTNSSLEQSRSTFNKS